MANDPDATLFKLSTDSCGSWTTANVNQGFKIPQKGKRTEGTAARLCLSDRK